MCVRRSQLARPFSLICLASAIVSLGGCGPTTGPANEEATINFSVNLPSGVRADGAYSFAVWVRNGGGDWDQGRFANSSSPNARMVLPCEDGGTTYCNGAQPQAGAVSFFDDMGRTWAGYVTPANFSAGGTFDIAISVTECLRSPTTLCEHP